MKAAIATAIAPVCNVGDFPWFTAHPGVHYLDNAATTHQPEVVSRAQQQYTETMHAPVHRGMYDAATNATAAYESVRETVRAFINAGSASEVVFTANATVALNLAAHIESARLGPSDEILLSVAEHHSNILPWQRVAKRSGAKLVWVELTPNRQSIDVDDFLRKLSARTKVVVITHVSNVLGALLPLAEMAAAAHRHGARVVVDATQTAGRMPFDVRALDVDYAAFSGHKLYGPTGIGWLYGKAEHIAKGEPLLVGGGSIDQVTRHGATWREAPWRYEAGTVNAAGAIGLQAAIKYLQTIGLKKIWQQDQAMTSYTLEQFQRISGLALYGPLSASRRVSIFSFTLTAGDMMVHSHDVAAIANAAGVAVRNGHHCAQPLMAALGVPEVTRASAGIYTTAKDIDALISAIEAVQAVFTQHQQTGAGFTKKPRTQGTRSTS